jgi:hypothetical protein
LAVGNVVGASGERVGDEVMMACGGDVGTTEGSKVGSVVGEAWG